MPWIAALDDSNLERMPAITGSGWRGGAGGAVVGAAIEWASTAADANPAALAVIDIGSVR